MDVSVTQVSRAKPSVEVADIVRQFGEAYQQRYPVSPEQRAALRAIAHCRTAALGGHVDACDACGTLRISYNSCRNRHCPKCGALDQARWLAARRAELLPIEYFHVVFTLDHALNPLARCNPKAIYDLLFASAAQTLKAFGAKYLHGDIGLVAVLHTWGQDLNQHLHLHCIVTGGALSVDGHVWHAAPPGFLFPVLPLSAAFRQAFCDGLARLHQRGELVWAGQCAALQDSAAFAAWLGQLRDKNWQVYIKPPFGSPEQVFDYLAAYLQRVAIANHRLLALEDGQVRWRWRDYRDHHQSKEMSLPALEFIRRFLLHVLPRGFKRVRHFGLFGNRQRAERLQCARAALGRAADPPAPVAVGAAAELTLALIQRLTGIDLMVCPVCGTGRMRRQHVLDPLPPSQTATLSTPQPTLTLAARTAA
jgi:hypothetical protein